MRYYLGCPIWSNRDWVGRFFTADARSGDYLRQYSSVFNTVEGNTTFYGLPKPETVQRWREEAAEGFQFCCKFPRAISHERRLRNAAAETKEMFERLAPLGDRLGPLFLQLPPSFGGNDLPVLADYLATLPPDFTYAVEVRQHEFFAKGEIERAFNRLLHERGIDRVILDSRALFSTPPPDEDTREAQRKKPRVPTHVIALGQRPLVRFIGHPHLHHNAPFLEPWLAKIAEWLSEGRTPYIFLHTPSNREAPELAQWFHDKLRARLDVPPLSPWPVHGGQAADP